jgi:hypothetical protein
VQRRVRHEHGLGVGMVAGGDQCEDRLTFDRADLLGGDDIATAAGLDVKPASEAFRPDVLRFFIAPL